MLEKTSNYKMFEFEHFSPLKLGTRSKRKLTLANTKWKEAKRNATKHHDTFMEQLVEARASGAKQKLKGN